MRRNEFEVKDLQEIRAFLQHCQVCRLALCDGGQPYLIPLSYGMHFDKTGNLTTLYLSLIHIYNARWRHCGRH